MFMAIFIMKLKTAFSALAWVFCTCQVSSFPVLEHAAQSDARVRPKLEPRISNDDASLWNVPDLLGEDFSTSDPISYNLIPASDTDAAATFSDANAPWSSGSGDDINGLAPAELTESIQEDTTASLNSADFGKESCDANFHPLPFSSTERRSDAYCPTPQSAPSSPNNLDIPSWPNIMEQSDPRVPIDVPLFDLELGDDLMCHPSEYWTHLCCDGPSGPWMERWNHYAHVSKCLPCTQLCFVFFSNFPLNLNPSFNSSAKSSKTIDEIQN